MNHRISIVTVNYNSNDFLMLLRESITQFSSEELEIIVVNNTEDIYWETTFPIFDLHHLYHEVDVRRNIGHGPGLNLGSDMVRTPYVLFLDVDCHFLKKGWEEAFVQELETCDVIAGKGVPEKPIRPSCMFMKTEIAQSYDWRGTVGYKGIRVTPSGLDVAIPAYYEMIANQLKVRTIETIPSRYETLSGEEYCINEVPFVYHHWHGTHLKERQIDFPNDDLQKNKEKLFRKIPWRIANDLF